MSNGTYGQNQMDLMSGLVDIVFMVYPRLRLDNCIPQEEIDLITSPNKNQYFNDYKNEGSTDFFIRMKREAVIVHV
ncbi:hypothetical protein [Peribacillus simplex]|uniref:hypothetical protein n=1 Tax=Peribacillus simplex TaxID=1478 RepID=UPI003D28F2D9